MLLVEWYRIDWFVWLPVILLVLLVVILVLRIIRRVTRWGPVEISHVQEIVTQFEEDNISTYIKNSPENQNPKENSSVQQSTGVIFIPSLLQKGEKRDIIVSSLALLHSPIFVLTPSHVRKWLIEEASPEKKLLRLIKEKSIRSIIVFDYAIPPILKSIEIMEKNGEKLPLVQWVFIRPTLSWSDILPAWKLFPFTSRWWTRQAFIHFQKMNNSQNKGFLAENLKRLTDIAIIHPQKTWLSGEGQLALHKFEFDVLKLDPKNIHEFTLGGWSFYRQETVLLGIINQFLK
jgi:hypothetical protein